MDPLRWTPYLEECLDMLDTGNYAPSDRLLVQHVRVQLLCNAVVLGPGGQGDAAHHVHVNTFKQQLKQLENSIPADLRSNGMPSYGGD
jgi:hypothetical protein